MNLRCSSVRILLNCSLADSSSVIGTFTLFLSTIRYQRSNHRNMEHFLSLSLSPVSNKLIDCISCSGPKNPFQGAISFDNVGMAWTAIFVVISLEGWTEIMYYVQDAHSFWDWLYFVLLIVIGSFLMINLCLVVIATQFSETKKRELERMRQERER